MEGLFHIDRIVWKLGQQLFIEEVEKHKQWYSLIVSVLNGQSKEWLGDAAAAEHRYATERLLFNIEKGIAALETMAELFPQMEKKLNDYEDLAKALFEAKIADELFRTLSNIQQQIFESGKTAIENSRP